MTRWESDRRDVGALRASVIVWAASLTVFATIYAIGRLCAGHPVAVITGAAVVLALYLWLFRDRNDTTTTDDTTEDPS
ncbi:MAG TPA: hypothetical protein VMV41_07440 [Cellulomonadaceae bacterium]|nr:hypothetical protein [Cellulomonadaceae bacterium]